MSPASAVPAGGLSDRFKRGADVARRLVEEIVEGHLAPGSSLGAEPVLTARFGVSRAVLREAVRILEHLGVAAMRTGRGGGLVVTAPSSRAAAAASLVYLRYRGVTARELRVARREVLGLAADLAARRGGGGSMVRSDEGPERGLRGVEELVTATLGNTVVTLLVRVLRRMTEELGEPPAAVPSRAPIAAEELRLREALASGDAAAARDAARACHDAALRWREA